MQDASAPLSKRRSARRERGACLAPPPAPHTLGSSLHLFLCPTEDKAAARWVHPEGRGLRTEEAASAPSAPSLGSLFAPVSGKELPGQDPVALVCLQGSWVRGGGACRHKGRRERGLPSASPLSHGVHNEQQELGLVPTSRTELLGPSASPEGWEEREEGAGEPVTSQDPSAAPHSRGQADHGRAPQGRGQLPGGLTSGERAGTSGPAP